MHDSRFTNSPFIDAVNKSGNQQPMLNASISTGGAMTSASAADNLNDRSPNTSEIVSVVEKLFFPDLHVTAGKPASFPLVLGLFRKIKGPS